MLSNVRLCSLPKLQSLVLEPGNSFCGSIPPGSITDEAGMPVSRVAQISCALADGQ